MSTFRGVVDEFPRIRIDDFRDIPGRQPPLARFLSHVHSDHLRGLEAYGGSFIYCSPATKELLIRLEKYHHRINFELGFLGSTKQTYGHLKRRLRTIPLNTSTDIELELGIHIRVTLLDANHCAGAVMFLIENDEKAILYTGDIRSEPWWVNSLIRNPVVLAYSHGHKRLDRIYLDTTFATKDGPYRRFPTKSAGLAELLEKVLKYPKETIFHFNSWTFGYEEVWIALSSTLRSQIHVDQYKCRLYRSLAYITAGENCSYEGSALFGFPCGHRNQAGCLTPAKDVRLHSCERGTRCSTLETADAVYIIPIISRSVEGTVISEVRAGGGARDLIRSHDLELEDLEDDEIAKLKALCIEKAVGPEARRKTLNFISQAFQSGQKVVSLDALDFDTDEQHMPLTDLAARLVKLADQDYVIGPRKISTASDKKHRTAARDFQQEPLPRKIEFPYSRHSSYEELCHLVSVFKPVDVYPCTVDEERWDRNVSMEHLFGHLCSGTAFAHDREMEEILASRVANPKNPKRPRNDDCSQSLASSEQGSVESQRVEGPDANLIGLSRSSRDPTPCPDVSDDSDRIAKRRRVSPPSIEPGQGEGSWGKADMIPSKLTPRSTLCQIRRSFEISGTPGERNATVPDPMTMNPNSHRTIEQRRHVVKDTGNVRHGTQAKPIELSDDDQSSIDTNNDDDDGAGGFLLDQIPEPDAVPDTNHASQSGPETQLSLSDTAFESQETHCAGSGLANIRVRHRKDAFQAAKDLSGRWAVEHSLISSRIDQSEELEL
ncbi:hypothetical protein N7G274_007867 [Stereocaulon virgatum]|uniref:Protein artemis n=1 Tax=Stereocaulon virgatum TaxID=373712 RepID=A0ABR4A3A1_9LECA